MSTQFAIDTLVEALTAIPEVDNPLKLVYAVLGREGSLTLQTIRDHSELIHNHAELTRDQTFVIQQVIQSCKTISPTPLPVLPLGF